MFLGFFAWYHGLALGGVAKIGQVQLAQPVLTLVWSALVLGEHVTRRDGRSPRSPCSPACSRRSARALSATMNAGGGVPSIVDGDARAAALRSQAAREQRRR